MPRTASKDQIKVGRRLLAVDCRYLSRYDCILARRVGSLSTDVRPNYRWVQLFYVLHKMEALTLSMAVGHLVVEPTWLRSYDGYRLVVKKASLSSVVLAGF